MKKLYIKVITFLLAGISFNLNADDHFAQSDALQSLVRIGHQGTLLDKSYYPVFEALYGSHGYKVQWVKVPVERSLVEIDSGNLDANLFSAELSKTYIE